jgi:hypothetical protein
MIRSKSRSVLVALVAVFALGALTATSALASGPPTVETTKASGVEETKATLNGVVKPNGTEPTVEAEYGPTISYGLKTKEQNIGSGTKNVGVSKNALSLTPYTTYHFRMVATNSNHETTYGADLQFFTAYPPGLPELVLASGEKYTHFETKAKGGSGYIEWSGGKSITCSSSEFSGHFINPKELEGTMRWSECFGGSRYECANEKTFKEGYISSWIQSETLKGTLGYINKAKKEVGLRLAGKSSEVWAKNVDCLGGTKSLNGSLGGQLSLPVNTKILTTQSFGMVYTEKEDKQTTGELGGQLLYSGSSEPFGFSGSLNANASKEFEIKA